MADDAKPSPLQKIKSRFNLSLAAMVSMVVAVLLIGLAAIAWVIYATDPTRVAWGDYMTIGRAAGLIALWATTIAVTYMTVRVWMNDVPIGHRPVSEGWKAGEQLLARHGVQLSDLPCFVVLGCPTRHQQEQWFGATGVSTPHPASGQAPAIDWHLDQDRILIFCRDLGVYGGLLRSTEVDRPDEVENHAETPSKPCGTDNVNAPTDQREAEPASTDSTILLEQETKNPVANDSVMIGSDGPQEDASGNVGSDDGAKHSADPISISDAPSTVAMAAPKTSATKSSAGQETTTFASAMQTLDRASALVSDAQSFSEAVVPEAPSPEPLSSVSTTNYQASMSQFCMRLRSARFPHSSINGILVLVDSQTFSSRTSTPREASESGRLLGRAIRKDLEQLQLELGVATPVTTLVSENNQPGDYLELCRRLRQVEPDRTTALGQTFSSEQIPTEDSMNELADNAIGQVENRIHKIFQLPRSLAQPQNYRLVRMLIRCRRWRSGLRSLMVESSATSQREGAEGIVSSSEPTIVSGLFVASPTNSPVAEGYVGSVIDRMISQQNHLAWTRDEQASWTRHRRALSGLAASTVLLAICLVVQLWIVLAS